VTPDRPSDGHRTRDTERLRQRAGTPLGGELQPPRPPANAGAPWALQSHASGQGSLQRTPLRALPFRLGRTPGCALVLASSHVSKSHAEIYSDGCVLRVRDLGSRNGTYLNRRIVSDAPLHEGDLLRLGDCDLRLVPDLLEASAPSETLPLRQQHSPVRLRELMDRGAVTSVFQPIVALPSGRREAFEALGRGDFPGLPVGPVELFELAGSIGPEVQRELSRLFRRKAIELVMGRARPPLLFLNTHPAEFESPGLVESLEELRAAARSVPLVLEIHESTLGQIDFLSWLAVRLEALDVQLAYDDFGAGEARLFELAEVPPHYLKFDRRFVDGIDAAPPSRQRLLGSLVAGARELQVATIAEGVERPEDGAACVRAGFSHAQGYFFGRPAPLASERA
jgi:EAL domain-containing protein (putative c-di-GMP-specific phosphodiesterase class I)